MNDKAADYIRANRHVYTRPALDKRLRAHGYTDEEIAAAWQAVLAKPAGVRTESAARTARDEDVSAGEAVMFGLMVAAGILLCGLTNLSLGFGAAEGWSGGELLWFVNGGSLVLIASLAVAGNWLAGRRGWSRRQVVGLYGAVLMIWYLIVAGSCLSGIAI